MKSSNVKKVLSIVILCLVVAITVATVVLAIVPKNLYNPIADGYYTVAVYRDKKDQMYHTGDNANEEDKAFIEKFNSLQEKSVRDNVLSALFQGTGRFEEKINYSSTAVNAMDKYANVNGVVCLVFHYLHEQTLQWNGKVATHAESKNEGKVITFTKMFMPIIDNDEFQKCTVYLTGSDNKTNYSIEFLAHQSDLYDYLTSLPIDYV